MSDISYDGWCGPACVEFSRSRMVRAPIITIYIHVHGVLIADDADCQPAKQHSSL